MLTRSVFRWKLEALVILAALICGYASSALAVSRPNHADALNQIRKLLGSGETYTITNLRYANGYVLDENNYVVVATFTQTFTVSSSEMANMSAAGSLASFLLSTLVVGDFEAGDAFDLTGEYLFLLTENGWILQGQHGNLQIVGRHSKNSVGVQQHEQQKENAAIGKSDSVGNSPQPDLSGRDPHWIKIDGQDCWMYNPHPTSGERVSWNGTCVNRLASGQGTAIWHNTSTNLNSTSTGTQVGGKFQGNSRTEADRPGGIHILQNMTVDDQGNGFGEVEIDKGGRPVFKYAGNYVNGQRSGQGRGVYYNEDGTLKTIFNGIWAGDQPSVANNIATTEAASGAASTTSPTQEAVEPRVNALLEGRSNTIVVDGVRFSRAAVNEVAERAREEFSKDPKFAGDPKLIENAVKVAVVMSLVSAAKDVKKKQGKQR